jgi:hypothetical protein
MALAIHSRFYVFNEPPLLACARFFISLVSSRVMHDSSSRVNDKRPSILRIESEKIKSIGLTLESLDQNTPII